jgi:hypothetical protein
MVKSSIEAATVGTPVTRRPPCSPGRAVFPHPVPRLHALPRRVQPCGLWPAGRLAPTAPLRRVRAALPCRAACCRRVLPHVVGVPHRCVLCSIQRPTRLRRAFPVPGLRRLPRAMVSSVAQVPAWFWVRVAPAGPQALETIRRCFSWGGTGGASHVLRHLSACMPRPEDSGGPDQPRPHGWSGVAVGVRENPRRPHQAPCRSCTSTAGDTAPPAASRIRCRRCAPLVHRVSTAPPWTPDSLRGGGSPLPDRDLHPARDAKLFLARERWR